MSTTCPRCRRFVGRAGHDCPAVPTSTASSASAATAVAEALVIVESPQPRWAPERPLPHGWERTGFTREYADRWAAAGFTPDEAVDAYDLVDTDPVKARRIIDAA